MSDETTISEYRCPGEGYPIARAVHLGRLARFCPKCRRCLHRHDTHGLSARQIRRLGEVAAGRPPQPLFDEDGMAGATPNAIGPEQARRAAVALGLLLQQGPAEKEALPGFGGERGKTGATVGLPNRALHTAGQAGHRPEVGRGTHLPCAATHPRLPAQAADRRPTVLLGGDDRPWTAACFAAASEGLRWSGCHVVDIGPASAPCLADTLQRLRAAGGLLIHNPSEREHLVGLKFWGPGAQPLARHDLARVEQLFHVPPDRPTRVYGSLDRLPAESGYLAHIAPCYHAMRPLQWVLHSACTPLVGYIRQLSARVACRVTVVAAAGERLGAQVLVHGSHFGLHVDGQGESCQWFDEAGRAVAAERMFLLMSGDWSIFRPNGVALANQSLAENMDLSPLRPENRNVILEEDSSPELQRELQARGFTVVRSGAARAEMAAAMHTHEAVLGGGPSGRFWHPKGTVALPDALMTLTLLLLLLSRNDRPLSTVLDAEASLR